MRALLTLAAISILGGGSWAQVNLVLQPDPSNGKDAILHGLISEVNNNWGQADQMPAMAWTFLGVPGVVRAVLGFDLSGIPQGSVVLDARLSLYAYDSPVGFGQHSSLSGPNDAWIRRIITPWDELTVTWNTAPSVVTAGQIPLPGTTDPLQDYLDLDVTAMVQDMVNDPANNHGFQIELQNETYYRRLNFATSEHADPLRRPKLEVTYVPDTLAETCITYSGHTLDALLHGLISEVNVNYGTQVQLTASAWTFNGIPGVVRGLLGFQGLQIPAGSVLTHAWLDLYAWDQPGGLGQHSDLSGPNDGWLQRVTSPWSEATVTWNTQPSTTPVNQVALAGTSNPWLNYTSIDVKALVQDMIDDPANSFGFLLRQQNENYYRRLNFCSSEHPDQSRWPKLRVCHAFPTAVQGPEEPVRTRLHPNPATDRCRVVSADMVIDRAELFDATGRRCLSQRITGPAAELDVSTVPPGTYIVHVTSAGGERCAQRLVIAR